MFATGVCIRPLTRVYSYVLKAAKKGQETSKLKQFRKGIQGLYKKQKIQDWDHKVYLMHQVVT